MPSPYLTRPLRSMDQAAADIERRRERFRRGDLLALGFTAADISRHLFAAAARARSVAQ